MSESTVGSPTDSTDQDKLLRCIVGLYPVVELKIEDVMSSFLLDPGRQVSIFTENFFQKRHASKETV